MFRVYSLLKYALTIPIRGCVGSILDEAEAEDILNDGRAILLLREREHWDGDSIVGDYCGAWRACYSSELGLLDTDYALDPEFIQELARAVLQLLENSLFAAVIRSSSNIGSMFYPTGACEG